MTELPELLKEMMHALLDLETDSYYGKCEFVEAQEDEHDRYLLIKTSTLSKDIHFTFHEQPGKTELPDYVIRWRICQVEDMEEDEHAEDEQGAHEPTGG